MKQQLSIALLAWLTLTPSFANESTSAVDRSVSSAISSAIVKYVIDDKRNEKFEELAAIDRELKERTARKKKIAEEYGIPFIAETQEERDAWKRQISESSILPVCVKIDNENANIGFIIKLRKEGYPALHASLFKEWPNRRDPDYEHFWFHLQEGHISPPRLVSISNIILEDGGRSIATVMIYTAPMSSVTYEYTLQQEEDVWNVLEASVKSMTRKLEPVEGGQLHSLLRRSLRATS